MRLAWFTPWPPQQTGVATCSAELVPALAARGHAVDVFVDEQRVPVAPADPAAPAAGAVRRLSAHDFVWRRQRAPYDLVVYQAGNSRHHQFLWAYLFQYPGLAVLHDTKLHHARGHALLSRARVEAYRAEFAWCHPGTSPDAAELGVHGYDGVFYSDWPMVRGVLAASRAVAAHARGAAREIEADWPGTTIHHIALGHGLAAPPDEAARAAARQRFGLPPSAPVFGVFGALTADKRLPEILRTFAAMRPRLPGARLLLAGRPDPALGLADRIAAADLAGCVHLHPALDDDDFDRAIVAADAIVALRWPSAGEVSGPWIRALSAGRPGIIMELAQHAGVPTLDPRSMQPHVPGGGPADDEPVALSIDILDEEHSLGLALLRLAEAPDLRARMGLAARRWWEREHTLRRMADDYEAVFEAARTAADPATPLPSHLRPDPWRHTRDLVQAVGTLAVERLDL